jgi:hypothetical protein
MIFRFNMIQYHFVPGQQHYYATTTCHQFWGNHHNTLVIFPAWLCKGRYSDWLDEQVTGGVSQKNHGIIQEENGSRRTSST